VSNILIVQRNCKKRKKRSRILSEIETGDSGPGVPGPPPQEVEGSGGPVPDSAMSHRSITEEAGASLSHPKELQYLLVQKDKN